MTRSGGGLRGCNGGGREATSRSGDYCGGPQVTGSEAQEAAQTAVVEAMTVASGSGTDIARGEGGSASGWNKAEARRWLKAVPWQWR